MLYITGKANDQCIFQPSINYLGKSKDLDGEDKPFVFSLILEVLLGSIL